MICSYFIFLADACFKAALSLVPEMPKTIEIEGRSKNSEPYLLSYLSNFLSTLLVVPVSPQRLKQFFVEKSHFFLLKLQQLNYFVFILQDSPEHGVLYLMRGLLNAVQRCFDENSSTKPYLYLRVLDLLSTITQETYPYHVDKVIFIVFIIFEKCLKLFSIVIRRFKEALPNLDVATV